ncbi:MAG TPA: hypothetical protein VG498_13760 [Terriglobales bacterium]|nr:hypothetical protein [Terriglobales bacterium]
MRFALRDLLIATTAASLGMLAIQGIYHMFASVTSTPTPKAARMTHKMTFLRMFRASHTRITDAQGQGGCALPSALSEEIVSKYPNAHVVRLVDLNEDDKKQFSTRAWLRMPRSHRC